jgi:putative flippase GtrA
MSGAATARWLVFNAVGAMGFVVQLACLWMLRESLGLHYLVAAAVAIELTIVHNFWWHARWTWGDRPAVAGRIGRRLLRFNLASGATSIGNLALMAALVEFAHMHYLVANTVAVIACSLVTFLLSDTVVFRPHS